MKNNLVKFLAPTVVVIILRLGLEFVFGINILSSDGWSFIWGFIAVLWMIATIVIGAIIIFETK
jgi:hypothetical protein